MENKGLHLPVIVITAFDEPKYRDSSREYGVLAFLRKPVDGEALLDIIKYNLESQLSTNNMST
jgi:two-component system sensor histidine kinase/response regulator